MQINILLSRETLLRHPTGGSTLTESPLLFWTDPRNTPGRPPPRGNAHMLCLLAFGDHEALMADTPTSQNVDSTLTEQPLLPMELCSVVWGRGGGKEGRRRRRDSNNKNPKLRIWWNIRKKQQKSLPTTTETTQKSKENTQNQQAAALNDTTSHTAFHSPESSTSVTPALFGLGLPLQVGGPGGQVRGIWAKVGDLEANLGGLGGQVGGLGANLTAFWGQLGRL